MRLALKIEWRILKQEEYHWKGGNKFKWEFSYYPQVGIPLIFGHLWLFLYGYDVKECYDTLEEAEKAIYKNKHPRKIKKEVISYQIK
jgi:hypothetical protein